MLFQGLNKIEDKGVSIDYTTTFKYDYDLVLYMAQHIINEDICEHFGFASTAEDRSGEQIECTEQLKAAQLILADCPETAEPKGAITIAGVSRILHCPLHFVFYAGTNYMRVMSPAPEFFEKYGEHILDNYMNSVEIMGYCRRTEIETEKRIREELEQEQGQARENIKLQ